MLVMIKTSDIGHLRKTFTYLLTY